MSFYYSFDDNGQKASGSKCLGNFLLITHRWHDCAKQGHYLATLCWNGWMRNINCIVDDFGDLVPMESR